MPSDWADDVVGPARAQAWPSKPIRIFVGFNPGGTTDPYACVYGEILGQRLNVPVVVENRPGAGGTLSLGALAAATWRLPLISHAAR